jgi:hypothetical protein
MFKFRIVASDGSGYTIGSVSVKGRSRNKAMDIITNGWEKFQATEPDTDDDYPQWLVNNYKGFKEIIDDMITVEV